MRKLIIIVCIAGILPAMSEVKEVYTPQVPTLGKPIAPPIRMMPPVELRPNPPTPEEIAAANAVMLARAEFNAALKVLLNKSGITNQTDLESLNKATARIESATVTITNQTTKITIGTEP